MKLNRFSAVISVGWILVSNSLFAEKNVTLISSYLGDGLFKYEMTVHNDPFFQEEEVSLVIRPFPDFIEVVEHSPEWQFHGGGSDLLLEYPAGDPDLERPYSAYCIVRSASTNYCTVSNQEGDSLVLGGLMLINEFDPPDNQSYVVVFYQYMDAIVPCSPEEADGTAAVCEYHLELIPDITIDDIIISTNSTVSGLTLSGFGRNYTVLVQACENLIEASTNLEAWVDVEYAWGAAGPTDWIAREPLENYGNFYRLEFVAGWHTREPVEGSSPMMVSVSQESPRTATSFRIQDIEHNILKLEIETMPQVHYVVSVKDGITGRELRTIEFTADTEHETVDLNITDFPSSAFVEVHEYK